MKVVIVDCFDSFTFNLFHYINELVESVEVIRYNELTSSKLKSADKILLSPGPGLPDDYKYLMDIIEEFQFSKSILGVCLGFQAIGSFYGAKLENLKQVKHGKSSKISVDTNDGLYINCPKEMEVGRYHSWCILKDSLPKCLISTSEYSSGIVMSFSHLNLDVKGVQYHPESIMTHYGKQIIFNWVRNQVKRKP